MTTGEVLGNLVLTLLCYGYVVLIIVVAGQLPSIRHISQKSARKFLHAMIGNLPFIIPFFTSNIYPVLVAVPFVLVTFLASPYSSLHGKLSGLASITEEGHPLGLVFYALSYTILAFFFASKPYVIAAGILPMAYGDSAASLIGEKYGKHRYTILAIKSVEGSLAMIAGSFLSLTLGFAYFHEMYSFSFLYVTLCAIPVALVAATVEGMSPKGFDNVAVPLLGASTMWLLMGG
jgi:phytol kinase